MLVIVAPSSRSEGFKESYNCQTVWWRELARQKRFHITFWSLTAIQSAVKLDLTCNDWQKSQRIYVHFHRVLVYYIYILKEIAVMGSSKW